MTDRLRSAAIGWLTTVAGDGRPQSSPVWFVWHDGCVYIATEPSAAKVRNVATHPAASFHLDGAAPGEMVVTMEGDVAVVDGMPPTYADKYAGDFSRLGTTASEYLARFSTTLRFSPRRQRVFESL